MPVEGRRPLALIAIAAVYLFSLLLSSESFGDPFPFMGRFYSGRIAECLVFADSLASLYLVIGILKRQRLTVWLMIAYNLVDLLSACLNLAFISPDEYARFCEGPIPQGAVLANTLFAAAVLVLISAYVFRNRRHFNNTSPYLF
ncbi:MAG TPA: hypothetical protein VJ550_02360 [Geomonas sp.]|nr:hypothetical protein [Geomonas sp.]